MKKKTDQAKKLPLVLFGLSFLTVALILLLLTPTAVKLVESQIISSFNLPWEKPQYLVQLAQGSEKPPTIKIVSADLAPPNFSSGALLAMDFDSGEILYQKNADLRLPSASTTKIMTALVAVDKFQSGDILTVPPAALVSGSSMGLFSGEKMTFRSLLYGMLLNSGNDASYAIALNYPGGFDNFVSKMNEKAVKLGLTNCHFENPAGFDGPTQYCSARDLAIIAKEAVLHPQLSTVVSTKETLIQSFDGTHNYDLRNLNKLLQIDGVIGIKTGTTELAGANFVGLVDRNGHKVITVVLHSQDRFGETKALMDWVYKNFSWQQQ